MPDLVKIGLNYRPDGAPEGSTEKRACPEGTCGPECPWGPNPPHPFVVEDLPAASRPWLLEQQAIAEVEPAPPEAVQTSAPRRRRGGEEA